MIAYKIFVAVWSLISQAELPMDYVFNEAISNLSESDSSSDENDPKGGDRAPDHGPTPHDDSFPLWWYLQQGLRKQITFVFSIRWVGPWGIYAAD